MTALFLGFLIFILGYFAVVLGILALIYLIYLWTTKDMG